jgi:site-specific DNA recombinase
MRAAIYVRVSTDRQVEGTSLDRQQELCINKAKELGYKDSQMDIYRDEGSSGEDIEIRPEMTKLRKMANDNVYKHVICYHPDRFSRDMTDKLIVCREFEKNNIELVFSDAEYNNSPEGKLFFNIISAIAEYEHGLIKKRTISGRLARVRNHKEVMPMRTPPFGYDWSDKQLVINEEEAETVRLVYKWYVYEQLTLREIGEKLYKLGATPKRQENKAWSASSISRILKSEVYIGKFYYNRLQSKKVRGQTTKGGNPKLERKMRDEEDWIAIEVPAIMDERTWNLAQKQRQKNKTFSGNAKYDYLLKSFLVCDKCGRKWGSTTISSKKDSKGERKRYRMYRCPNKNPKQYGVEKCEHASIRADILEEYIWENFFVQSFKNPELLKEQVQKFFSSNTNDVSHIQHDIDLLEKNLKSKEEEKKRVRKMFRMDLIDEDEMQEEMKDIKNDIDSITFDINELKAKISSQSMIKENEKMYVDAIDKLCKVFEDDEDMDFDLKRRVIELLVEKITIKSEGKRKFDVEIQGVIKGVLADGYNRELSTDRFDDINTTNGLEMVMRSRFELIQELEGRYYRNRISGEEVHYAVN